MTAPGIPNEYSLSTSCFGSRLTSIEDQIFAAVAMGFRRLELGLSDSPPSMEGLEDSKRETSLEIGSLVAGCRDSLNGSLAVNGLGSPNAEERERALNSVRRHVRLARAWGCPVVILRGGKIDAKELRAKKREVESKLVSGPPTDELKAEVRKLALEVRKRGQRQVEHLCRSLHTLMNECPEVRFAVEPAAELDDLLDFEAVGWVLDDLPAIGYWHDVGSVHMRGKLGLAEHGQWLDGYSRRMLGVHLQDVAEDEDEVPPGAGEVDFRLLAGYVPRDAQRVLELHPRHGRGEILASIQFLVDHGF